jgi:hypothetical protein
VAREDEESVMVDDGMGSVGWRHVERRTRAARRVTA